MKQKPRPTALVRICTVMLTLPAVLLIATCFLALISMAGDDQAASSPSGPAWLGVVMFPVPTALLIMAEVRAICRRDSKAAAWIAGLCLWFPILGSIGWIEGLLSLSGVLSGSHDWQTWGELGIYSAVLAYMAFVGYGHLQWWRLLRASQQAGSVARNA